VARDIFVSYSQPDRECAFAVVRQMEARGLRIWIAPRDVAPAADWAAEIIDAISSARLMLLIFSGASNDSAQVRREVERAVHKQRPVLPFRIEDVLPSKSLEYFLSAQHWIDAFPPPLEPHVERLCDYLGGALDGIAHDTLDMTSGPPRTRAAEGPPVLPAPDPVQLRLLEAELARWIGPVATLLVRRAAKDGGNLDALAQRLAPEVDDGVQRRAFLEACWRIGRRSQ